MSDIKWIKITTDIFDDEKILLIESLPAADSIIVIWFKLLCLAGKQNNNGVFVLNDRIVYNEKMLAQIFRREETTVRLALETFEQFGMIEIIDGVITIPNWGKHQNFDKIEKRNEYMRKYMSEYREKQKLIANGKANCKTNSKTNVSDAEEEIEEERDKDIKKDKRKEDRSAIISYLNEKLGTSYRPEGKAIERLLNGRLEEGYTVDDFKKVIDNMVSEWGNDEKMQQYLRPSTLFTATHFPEYLNRKPKKKKSTIDDYGPIDFSNYKEPASWKDDYGEISFD